MISEQMSDATKARNEAISREALQAASAGATSEKGKAPLVGTGSWLEGVLRAGYEPGKGDTYGEQMINGQWWRPKLGCYSLAEVLEAVEAEAPSNSADEPRGKSAPLLK